MSQRNERIQPSPQERILEEYKGVWIPKGLQASQLLALKSQLLAFPSVLPTYDAIAQSVGTVIRKKSKREFDGTQNVNVETEEQISFATLMQERMDLHAALLPAVQAAHAFMARYYAPDARNRPTFHEQLAAMRTALFDGNPFQHTLETIFNEPLESQLNNVVSRLSINKNFVPTDEELKRTERKREDTTAAFDGMIETLQKAYAQLQTFQERAKVLHNAVLPKLQESYRGCADQLAAMCTDAARGIIDNPAQYFAPNQEKIETPHAFSRSFAPLRDLVMALRSTGGGVGVITAGTMKESTVAGHIQHALRIATEEREVLQDKVDASLLAEFDASLTADTPAKENPQPITPETVKEAGEVSKRRRIFAWILRRKT
jgi:hypothetical protein